MEDLSKSLKVEFDATSGVAQLIMNRPSRRNALDDNFFKELPRILSSLDDNPSVRVVILKGSGNHFCSGIDFSFLTSFVGSGGENHVDDDKAREKLRRNVKHLQGTFSAIEECRKPVIAAVQGGCIGLALDLVTACDVRYCSEDAFFSVKEVDLGIPPDFGTLQRLPRLVGEGNARDLAFTARRVDAIEAKQMGLVQRVFRTKLEMDENVTKIAMDIAAKSPLAVIGTKATLLNSRDLSVASGLDYVAGWVAPMLLSTGFKESFTAILEKRKPVFSKL